jgi:hypothetical protein
MTPALQSLQASFFVPIQPAIYGIGITPFQEPALGDRMGRLALGDLENRRTPLANIRPQIMISTVFQFLLLYSGQLHRSLLQNRLTSYVATTFWIKPHPPPFSYNEAITEVVRQNSLGRRHS